MAVLRAALAVSFVAPKECSASLYSAMFRESARRVKEPRGGRRITSHKGTTPDTGATTMSRTKGWFSRTAAPSFAGTRVLSSCGTVNWRRARPARTASRQTKRRGSDSRVDAVPSELGERNRRRSRKTTAARDVSQATGESS